MSALNPAQIAALQQMGICVWQSADNAESSARLTPAESSAQSSSDPVNQTVVKATSEERRASGAKMLAQLRSSLGADSRQTAQQDVSESDAPQTSALPEKTVPVAQPLTAEQRQRFARLITDIQQAATDYGMAEQVISVMQGDTLLVDRETVVLPGGPDALTPQLKRKLWHALATLA